jgi:hypothetical protein
MADWIDNESVFIALRSGDFSVLRASGYRYCLSQDQRSCVLVREHSAWLVPAEGWRDSNDAPKGEIGRAVLNFFVTPANGSPGVWFKCFLPLSLEITSLEADTAGNYVLQTRDATYKASFSRIPSLMWKLMTGDAEKENDIEAKFQSIWL